MQSVLTCRARERTASLVSVALLIFSLSVSVATRFVHYYEPYQTNTKATPYSPQSKRQDLERDGLQFGVPVVEVAYLPPPRFEKLILEPQPLTRTSIINQRLYTRPPPPR